MIIVIIYNTMKTTIKTLDNQEVIISNDGFDNDNFINVGELEISLDDLLSALKGFEELRRLNSERDKRYETN